MKLCVYCMEQMEEDAEKCSCCGNIDSPVSAEENHLPLRSIIYGKYIVGMPIGQGAFGITYIGYDAELKRKVAIKEYLPSEFSNRVPGESSVLVYEGDKMEQFLAGKVKFLEEASTLARFHDLPNIAQVYDCFEANNTAYLVMEYLQGETLKEKVKREGKMTLEASLEIVLAVLQSVKVVHKSGLLHRGIAPDNIFITESGDIKLIDFCASRFATTSHSRSLTVLVKQGFAPVEQYNSRGDQGTWTDVYGLAATFYYMLTGITPQDAMERKVNDMLRAPSKEGAKVSKNVDTAIMNALNLGIEYRTKTMEDFEKELYDIDEVVRIIEPTRKSDLGKFPKWAIGAMVCLGILLVAFAGMIATEIISFGQISSGNYQVAMGNTYVPGFVNQNYTIAGKLAEENKVQIQIVNSIQSKEVDKNVIISQSISSGSEVAENSTVELVVSSGPGVVSVPVLVGTSLDEAKNALEEAELIYEVKEIDSNELAGIVVSQSIEEMTIVEKGELVVIEISSGTFGNLDTTKEVEMPDLTGKTYEEARQMLYNLGLYVKRSSEYSIEIKKDLISSQSRAPKTILHQGDIVEVLVSLGKKKVLIPYVLFKPEAEATKTLEELELVVEVSYEQSKEVKEGNVISQSIDDGTQAEAGDKIALVVSLGAAWSDDVETLPAGVNKDDYEIEEIKVYRSATLETTTSESRDLEKQGWTYTGTSTKNGDYQEWSEWSDTSPAAAENRQIENRTMYQSRTKSTTTSTSKSMAGWNYIKRTEEAGGWSSYGRTPINAEETEQYRKEVETRTGNESVKSGTRYVYYHYYIPNGRYSSADGYTVYWTYSENFAKGSSGYTYEETTSDQKQDVIYVGKAAYWYSRSEDVYSDVSYTEYRSRTVTYTYHFEKFSDWGAWSATPITANNMTEVQTKTQYRYRDLSKVNVYSFERWGSYSEWQKTPITASKTVKVEEGVRYRYREKVGK